MFILLSERELVGVAALEQLFRQLWKRNQRKTSPVQRSIASVGWSVVC